MTGDLKNLPKSEKIFQYCGNDLLSSCKVFLFITSDSKLVQIAFIDAASYLPPPFYLLWCHSVRGNYAAVAFAPFLLILLKSGPRDDETFLPFSGSLWKRFLIFKAEKTSTHLRFVASTDPHITYPEMKTKGTTTSKKCHQHIILYATPADEVRQLQDVRPCQPWPGVFLSFRLTPVAKHNQHVGLFRLFSEAAWWRSSCLIHRWP